MNYDVIVYENLSVNTGIPKTGYLEIVDENVSFNNTLIAGNNKNITVNENLSFNNTSTASKLISIIVEDNFGFSNEVTTNAQYLQKISENLQINAFINSYKEVNGELELDDSLDCWVVNYENNAFSRYSNFDFNSFANLNGKYFAANELGLFSLGGDTDNEKIIPSKILTGKMDVSRIGALSYVREVWLYHKSDGSLRMNIKASDGRTESYKLVNPTDEFISSRIKNVSQGRKAIYWQFELTNDEQTDFELQEIKIYKAITGRST